MIKEFGSNAVAAAYVFNMGRRAANTVGADSGTDVSSLISAVGQVVGSWCDSRGAERRSARDVVKVVDGCMLAGDYEGWTSDRCAGCCIQDHVKPANDPGSAAA